jgi:hypothetical protein
MTHPARTRLWPTSGPPALPTALLAIACALVLTACDTPEPIEPTPGTYYVVDGLAVMEAENTPFVEGGDIGDEWTGMRVAAEEGGATVDFVLADAPAGDYTLWTLGRRGRNVDAQTVPVMLDGQQVAALDYGDRHVLRWDNMGADGQPIRLNLEEADSLRISFALPYRYVLDKVVLARDESYAPQGTGPFETATPDAVPEVENRYARAKLPPAWAFGVLYGGYTNQQESLERVATIQESDLPIDGYWIDSWIWDYETDGQGPHGYTSFVPDTLHYPDPAAMWGEMQDRGVKSGIWLWNTILQKGNEEVYADFLERGYCEEPYLNTNGWHNEGSNSMTCDIDFRNPEAVAYFHQKMKPIFDQGLDFLKLDRNADVPFTKAGYEATQQLGLETGGRGFVLAHLHYTSKPELLEYPTKWSGDAKIAWTQPDYPHMGMYAMGGYKENIAMVADPRLTTYEVPFLTNDIGGFNFFGSDDMGPELITRWAQFSSFNPVMHFFSTPDNPTSNMPFNFGEEALDTIREHLHLRAQLFPYIYSYAHRTRVEGRKMIQGEAERPYQYRFGDELLVAPVYEPGATSRTLYLPGGSVWYDYWTGERYDGGQEVTVAAPLSRIPVFAHAGAIIPMRDYAPSVEAGTNQRLTLDVYAGADGDFVLYEDDGTSEAYMDGGLATTRFVWDDAAGELTLEATEGTYDGAYDERTIVARIHHRDAASGATLGGEALPEASADGEGDGWWVEDGATHVRVTVPTGEAATIALR